jgi:UDP-glucose-4-epimerase GalE
MPRVLVTGGAGYIGAHTVHHLVRNGLPAADIVVFDNLSTGHADHQPKGVQLFNGDLASPADVRAVFDKHRISRVLHFAGVAYVGESMRDPGKYFRVNTFGSVNLLEAMQAAGCRELVFSSSCTTYGLPQSLPISEEHPQQPISPYGESKLMVERALRWYGLAHGVRGIALRYFNAAGAGYGIGESHEPETHLIPNTMRAVLGQGPALEVYGSDYDTPDGTCIRDYIHVLDLAEAHMRALKALGSMETPFTAFNLGTGSGTSVQQVVQAVRRVAGRDVPVKESPRRAGDPAVLVASAGKAAEVLGWRAQYDIQAIIKDAWDWHAKRV